MKLVMTTYLALISVILARGQDGIKTNLETEKWQIGESKYICSGIDLAPDGKTVVLGRIQGFPLCFYDLESKTIRNEIEISGYYAGPKVSYSKKGSYLLLQQQFYIDHAPNRDRQVLYEVMSNSGQLVLKVENAHSAAFSPDEKYLITLEGADVCWYTLSDGRKEKSKSLPYATSSIAITPDGRELIISHEPSDEELENISSVRNDKKAMKSARQFRELISFFDFETFKKNRTVNEVYDIIFHMRPSSDGKTLFLYARPHTKLKEQGAMEGYINTVDLQSAEPKRASFMSRIPEPDFKDSPDGKYFAVVSSDRQYPQLHIYEAETGAMVTIFDITHYFAQRLAKGEFGDGRSYFVWSGNDEITLVYGNHLLKWRIPS